MGIPQGKIKHRRQREHEEGVRRKLAKSKLPKRQCPVHQHGYIDRGGGTSRVQDVQDIRQQLQQSKEQMIRNGWCPHQVHHLSKKYDLQTFVYLATLKVSRQRSANHERCSEYARCVAYNTDPNTYESQHTTVHCKCPMVCVPYRTLIKTIKMGRVPLVSIESTTDTTSDRLKLNIHARHRNTDYVAISHVWAHGFGNVRENGLPSCQLERLRTTLLAFPESRGLFWMDTLCVPVSPNDKLLRLQQIDNMASIYKGASCSLLLDAELMNTVCNPDPAFSSENQLSFEKRKSDKLRGRPSKLHPVSLGAEMYARLACSVWMTRSWTLQEGQLPSNLAVQFQNCVAILGPKIAGIDGLYTEQIINTDFEIKSVPADTQTNEAPEAVQMHERLTVNDASIVESASRAKCECFDIVLQRALHDTFFAEANRYDLVRDFAVIWDELAGRTTTKSRDVPLIMTNMLDLSNDGLLDLDDTGQMFQTILLSLNRIPVSIFFNTGPRHDEDGHHNNRWIPTEIGAFGLAASREELTIGSNYLEYVHAHPGEDQDVIVYTMESILPCRARTHVSLGSSDTLYCIESTITASDNFCIEGFTSTCLIVERSNWSGEKDFFRGACFYVPDSSNIEKHETLTSKRNTSTRRFWKGVYRKPIPNAGLPHVEMIFYCPLQFRKVAARLDDELVSTPTYILKPLKDSCSLRINYDPLPSFKPLKILGEPDYLTWMIFVGVWTTVVVSVVVGWYTGGLMAVIILCTVGPFVALMITIGRKLLSVITEGFEAWSYVRSFQATRKRHVDSV